MLHWQYYCTGVGGRRRRGINRIMWVTGDVHLQNERKHFIMMNQQLICNWLLRCILGTMQCFIETTDNGKRRYQIKNFNTKRTNFNSPSQFGSIGCIQGSGCNIWFLQNIPLQCMAAWQENWKFHTCGAIQANAISVQHFANKEQLEQELNHPHCKLNSFQVHVTTQLTSFAVLWNLINSSFHSFSPCLF